MPLCPRPIWSLPHDQRCVRQVVTQGRLHWELAKPTKAEDGAGGLVSCTSSYLSLSRRALLHPPQLAGRLLKYSYHIARVSSWIESRMRAAMTKNIVFPG